MDREFVFGGSILWNEEVWLLFLVCGIEKCYGVWIGCIGVGFDLWLGEVLGIVGESGLGKFMLFGCLLGQLWFDVGLVVFDMCDQGLVDILILSEVVWWYLGCIDWVFVY